MPAMDRTIECIDEELSHIEHTIVRPQRGILEDETDFAVHYAMLNPETAKIVCGMIRQVRAGVIAHECFVVVIKEPNSSRRPSYTLAGTGLPSTLLSSSGFRK